MRVTRLVKHPSPKIRVHQQQVVPKKTGYKQSRKEIADKVKAAMKKNDGLKDARAKIVDKLMFIINVNVILQLPLILYLIFFSWYKYPANQQNLLEDFE